MSLIDKVRDYSLQKSRNIAYRPADYRGFAKLKKLAIVFEDGDQNQAIKNFAKRMRDSGKKVHLLAYIPRKRKEIMTIPEFDHFTKDEVNWFGKPKSEDVSRFLEETHEVFITLNERKESPTQFVTVAAKADFVIGLRNGKVARMDLQVEGEDYSEMLKEVEYYLRFINEG